MKKRPSFAIGWVLAASLLFASCSSVKGESMQAIEKNGPGVYAVITTAKGDIVLYLEYQKTPLTVTSFVGLAEGTLNKAHPGQPFYDGLTFHRVVPNFMIQGGDPAGNGTGGPGYEFANEIVPSLKFDAPGILGMANAGPDTNGSQFFITHVATPFLDGQYTVFGHVVAGQKVVDSIVQGDKIEKITIVREGADAQKFHPTQASFDALEKTISDKNAQAAKAEADAEMTVIDKLSKGATVTPSGLRYFIVRHGTGPKPTKGQTVIANYEGRLPNGQVFDSSYKRGQPIEFPVGEGRVIPGWDEALMDMRVGEKRTLIIPPALGYGSRGVGPIPPNSWLIFDVELVGLK